MTRKPWVDVMKTYKRGERLIFSPSSVERAWPNSVEKGTSSCQHEAPLQKEEHVDFDSYMEDLEIHEEEKSPKNIIKENEA